MGFMTRLAQENYYNGPNWILQLADLRPFNPGEKVTFLTPDKYNFEKLSYISRVDEETLWLMLPPISLKKMKPSLQSSSFCPICLQQNPYYKAIWQVPILTTCVEHQCSLINACPHCQTTLSLHRASIVRCKCGYDLRKCSPSFKDNDELELPRFVHTTWNNLLQYNRFSTVGSEKESDCIKNLTSLLEFICNELKVFHHRIPWSVKSSEKVKSEQGTMSVINDEWNERYKIILPILKIGFSLDSAFSIAKESTKFEHFILTKYYSYMAWDSALSEDDFQRYFKGDKVSSSVVTSILESFQYYYSHREVFHSLSMYTLQNILLEFLKSTHIIETIEIHWYPNITGARRLRITSTIEELGQSISRIAEDSDMPNLTFMDILYNSPMRGWRYDEDIKKLSLVAPKPAWWTAKFPRKYSKQKT